MNHDNSQDPSDPEMAGDSSGDPLPIRPQGRMDSSRDPKPHAPSEDNRKSERNPLEGIDLEQLRHNPVLLAQITASLQENHLHLPILTPDREEMAAMRRDTPELYKLYVDGMQKSIDADFIQRTYPYTEPLKNVTSGRRYGLTAVLAVLGIAGYALYLDLPWFAGIITALDVIGLAAVFGGTNNRNSARESNG